MKIVNIVCTAKPGDGLLHYSYEHCCFLNSIGIKSQLIIITNHKYTDQDYIDAIKDSYIKFENIIFNDYTPSADEITLIMGRSMLSLAYRSIKDYDKDTQLTLHLLFGGHLISVYSENHPRDYPLALEFFKPKKVYDLCDYEVYPNGVGKHFEKIINFSIYKTFKPDIKFQYLFLGTNEIYYKEVEDVISHNYMLYQSHGIITYKDKFINPDYNNVFVPIKNLLGLFETYVYTKPNFDPAPRIMQECKYFGKKFMYLRDHNIKDGGPVYYKRPATCLTDPINKPNIEVIIKAINDIV